MTSSKRFKQDIKPMDDVSEALYSLKPVSFRYKKESDPAGTPQLGLVAERSRKGESRAGRCPTKTENPTPCATSR